MSKAFLVVDTPNNCKECRFFQEVREEDPLGFCKDYKCFFGCSHIGCFIERPKDCPLKPLPEKSYGDIGLLEDDAFTVGYNACIDEILGDGE